MSTGMQEKGLTTQEAQQLLQHFGPNSIPEKLPNSLLTFLRKFWAPIPWMLEITIILQLIIGKDREAIIFICLLLFNSLLSFIQEERASKALVALRKHLAIKARALRDAKWQMVMAADLVPGDIVHLRMGDIVPADILLITGDLLLDQSALTGEALPIDCHAHNLLYAGSLITRGEGTGRVTATGLRTYFGKTTELIKTAVTQSHIKNIIFKIVKYLVAVDCVLATMVFIFALITKQPLVDIIQFILILLVSAIPAALPATFTLATAIGARHLADKGVLVTHLTAIEEAAVVDTICLDKTGTITHNQLRLAELVCYSPYSQDDLLRFALLASDEATQDPIDLAIYAYPDAKKLLDALPERKLFFPFDPAKKRTEVVFTLEQDNLHVIKGSPEIIAEFIGQTNKIFSDVAHLAQQGFRVIVVVAQKITDAAAKNDFQPVGLLSLYDPPREDAKLLIDNLKQLGLRVQMVTGDNLITAAAIAEQVGIGINVCSKTMLEQDDSAELIECDVFAGVFPEDKFKLVQAFQHLGHTIGMTGDGVNDAPSLKQAEVGVAVVNATDVAKDSASIILTKPGLSGLVSAIESSRRIHKRMLTYILNKITKSIEIAVFLCFGVMLTKSLIITPLLMVFLLFSSDFMTMSIATDNVTFSPKPEKWRIPSLMLGGGSIACLILLLSFSVFFFVRNYLHLSLPEIQTLNFVLLAFTGQANIFLVREREHLWHSKPGKWMFVSSIVGVIIVSVLATQGILMAAIKPLLIASLLGIVLAYLVLVDFIKVQIFSRFAIM